MNNKVAKKLVVSVFKALKEQNIVTFKSPEEKVITQATSLILAEYAKEAQLDEDVVKMMDQLERANPGTFERYKMFPMLKKRLAKEKGIIL